MDNILSKEKFVKVINSLKNLREFESELNNLICRRCDDGYVSFPDSSFIAICVLEKMFEDDSQWIDYFCWELEYGEKYEPGMVEDGKGEEIKLQTPEDLYDMLINNLKIKYGGDCN